MMISIFLRHVGAMLRMTALAERELRFADLKAAMEANPPDDSYFAEPADWEAVG